MLMEQFEMDNVQLTIPDYFKEKDVFITGATGIMGKVLVEKLLRSCPNINRIYLLLRQKYNYTKEKRLNDLKSSMVFDRLKKENPTQLDKLFGITGDVAQLQLNISDEDVQCLENVSVVFHLAATIRFDEPIKKAIIINVRGTREVLLLAQRFKKLEAFIHTSTAYSNPDRDEIEEKLYGVTVDWQQSIKMAETMNEEHLNAITTKYINWFPNTYTFTKGLAEHCVADFSQRLPVLIFRPSIVISALEEPMPGWFDAFVGPIGLLCAGCTGLCRRIFSKRDQVLDFMPVDVAVKGLITSAWHIGLKKSKNELNILNCVSSSYRAVNLNHAFNVMLRLIHKNPFNKTIWLPNVTMEPNRVIYLIKVLLVEMVVAFLLDTLLWIFGQKPIIMKLQRHIFASQQVHEFFTFKTYQFKYDGLKAMRDSIQEQDMEAFDLMRHGDLQLDELCQRLAIGIRRYLLKENDETIERAKIVYKVLYILDKLFKCFLLYLCYIFIGNSEYFMSMLTQLKHLINC